MRIKPLTLALAGAFVLPVAHADEAVVAAATDAQFDEIVVSGSRAETKLSETPVSIGQVKAKELERDKPKTMGDIINRVPGVYWNDLGNEQHSMAIRQPISTNPMYQYLEDGIPIRPLGVFNHNSLNEMNMNGAESVEVVKGAASSLYGSNAVGGAVNFLTAAPSKTPWAMAGVRYEPKSEYKRYDTGFSNTWDDLGVRFTHYSSLRGSDNWQQYTGGSKDSFTLRTDYRVNDSSRIRATVVHTDLDTETNGSLFENDYYANPGKSINTFTYRKDKTSRANLAWEGETLENGITTATLFWRRNDHGQLPNYTIRVTGPATATGTLNNNHVDSLGVDLKHEQNFDWLASRLVAGVYYDRSDNPYVSDNLDIVRDAVTGVYTSYSISAAQNGRRDYTAAIDNRALFAQWEASPVDRLRTVVGGRYDTIQYDFTNNLAPGGSADYGAANEVRSFSRFSPKLGATWALDRSSSVFGNISEGFTPPEVSQLYSKTAIPDLDPAVFRNYEMGYRRAFLDGALRLDTSVYRLEGKDTIVSYTIAPGNSENRNAGKTRSQGLELGLYYDAGAWDGRLGTTFVSHRYLEYQASPTLDYSGKIMKQAPGNITNAEVGYRPAPGVRVAAEVVHLGPYWMNDANTVRYEGHTLLNLRGTWKVGHGWEAWAQVRNVTDRHYADNASSSYSGTGVYSPNTQNTYTVGAPRMTMVGLTYTFGGK